MAYSPRGRAKSMEARIRWPARDEGGAPRLLAHAGFKAGCVQLVTIDDREHTPNAGKQLVVLGTVLATPPAFVLGARGYSAGHGGRRASFDVRAEDVPKEISKYADARGSRRGAADAAAGEAAAREAAPGLAEKASELRAVLAISPRAAGLEQKRPYVFESAVAGGGSRAERYEYLAGILGKYVKIGQVFGEGAGVDAAAITKGKGWQGVIQRMGAKRKQHKSRKTVRELGSLGPISPQYVMYTVPRAGQMGFHQRTEYNKRVMVVGEAEDGGRGKGGPRARGPAAPAEGVNPPGGFKHFGLVGGDYMILKGSIPGTYRRLVKLRRAARNAAPPSKPSVLEVVA